MAFLAASALIYFLSSLTFNILGQQLPKDLEDTK